METKSLKNKIIQNIPNSVDTNGSKSQEFDFLSELLKIPFVASWESDKSFLRWSLSKKRLMAEFSPTSQYPAGSYFVVGYLQDISNLELPIWIETPMQTARREAWNRGKRSYIYNGKEYCI